MIKSALRKTLLVVTLGVFVMPVLLGLPLNAQGNTQEKDGIGISPTKLTIDANPGETIEGSFLVTNPGTTEAKYSLYVRDFSVINEEYEKVFEPIEGATSPVDWITVPEGQRSVKAGDREQLSYKITVPEDAVPRGYYAVIFAETDEETANSTGVARIKRVGTLVYLTVKGGTVEKGELVSFDADTFQNERPVKAELRINNEGNVHFTVDGTLRLRDIFGREVSKTSISGTVLPATTRKFNSELELSQPFGLYKMEGEVNFLGKTTVLNSNWVVVGSPFWIVLWAVILIGWAVVLTRWIVKRVKRKKSKK